MFPRGSFIRTSSTANGDGALTSRTLFSARAIGARTILQHALLNIRSDGSELDSGFSSRSLFLRSEPSSWFSDLPLTYFHTRNRQIESFGDSMRLGRSCTLQSSLFVSPRVSGITSSFFRSC